MVLALWASGLGRDAGAQVSAPWPTAGWAVSDPVTEGLDPVPLEAFHRAVDSGAYGAVNRFFVVRNGFVVADYRYGRDFRELGRGRRGTIGCGEGACEDWSGPPEFNYYDPDIHPFYRGRPVHSLQSVTKSVAATLIGIAIHRGRIAGLSAPLLPFLGDYDLSRVDPRLRQATLEDLLTMRSGIEWHEGDRPLDTTNTTVQLEVSRNWVQFTLDQPMDAAPGTKWTYNSGGSHLMSAILRRATGRDAAAYAEEHLFGPLGITDYHWKRDPTGLPDTEGGLYLEAPDLARIGYLYLQDGVWEGRRILPEGWVAAATAPHVRLANPPGWHYGYQWWRIERDGQVVWAGLGFGAQCLLILPQHQIVAVVNSWTLFDRGRRQVLPAVLGALLASAGGREP